MSAIARDWLDWGLTRDEEGYREYKLLWLVEVDDPADDGPYTVINASGLPIVGSNWSFGNENDPWVFCRPTATARRRNPKEGEKTRWWTLEQTFSNKPGKAAARCQDNNIDDPLAEPPKVSGSFVRYTKETTKDRNGKLIKSSSHELIPVPKDANRPSVVIEQNSLALGLPAMSQMQDTLNDSPLWGLSERKIKLSSASWTREILGTCTYYYTRRLEFEIRFEGFDDAEIADKGFRHLYGQWGEPPNEVWTYSGLADKTKWEQFVAITDKDGNLSPVALPLDGNGKVVENPADPASHRFLPAVELYGESNFYLLGIPSSF